MKDDAMIKTAQELLADTADQLETHGWTRGKYRDDDNGCMCAMGALYSATSEAYRAGHWSIDSVGAKRLLAEAINDGPVDDGSSFGDAHRTITAWNDRATTAEYVIDFIRKVASA
jgi:hypothetical protein